MLNYKKIGNLLQSYILRTKRAPELAHLIALEFDATLRHGLKIYESVTYSSFGLKVGSNNPEILDINDFGKSFEKNFFQNTPIEAINSLNIHYANKLINNKILWLHFIEKYFYPLKITDSLGNDHFIPIRVDNFSQNYSDEKVTVIMTAFNAEKTIQAAAESILNQSHYNLELIIINDCSDDGTMLEIKKIINKDRRVIVQNNEKNLGSYRSRNIALSIASGHFITCHDADDYAFPNRIEIQLNSIKINKSYASICHMLRMKSDGEITRFSEISKNSPDGWKKLCHISMMYESNFFKKKLGHWDSVKAAADSEIINRTIKASRSKVSIIDDVLILALDTETCTTRSQEIGLFSLQGQENRRKYKEQWMHWHNTAQNLYIPYPVIDRPFPAPIELI